MGHDAEAQSFPREVLVEDTAPSQVLTSAWYNPDVLSPNINFVGHNKDVVTDTTMGNTNSKKAILVKKELSRFGFLVALNALLLGCVGVGIGVGFVVHSSDSGVLVATGLATFVLCVKAFHL
jgi:hypothetical protein